jgi:hypothetical protein
MRVVGEHSLRNVTGDRHDGAVTSLRFRQFSNRVVPQVVEAQASG